MSFLPSSTPVTEFGLAINRRWRSRDGEGKTETCFVDCRAYGRSAETINQHMTKGQPILIEGRLQFQQWTSPEGEKRSKHEVIVENFTFVGGRGEGGAREPGADSRGAQAVASGGPAYDDAPPPNGDDIPF